MTLTHIETHGVGDPPWRNSIEASATENLRWDENQPGKAPKESKCLAQRIEPGTAGTIPTSSKISSTLSLSIFIYIYIHMYTYLSVYIVHYVYMYTHHSMTSVVWLFPSFYTLFFWFVSEVTATCPSMPSPTRGASVLRQQGGLRTIKLWKFRR